MALILDESYFDAIYASSEDPWSFSSRWYETRKYDVIVASLPRRRYERAFEPGCSVGILSTRLAQRCTSVLSMDISARAVERARRQVPDNVELSVGAIPDSWPDGRFDLVVLSDVCHYFDGDGLDDVFARARTALRAGGTLIAAHWRYPVADYPSSGDAVHARLDAVTGLARIVEHVEEDFRLSVHIRAPDGTDPRTLSVAAQEGWLGEEHTDC